MSRVNDPSDDLLHHAINAMLELPTTEGPSAQVMSRTLKALREVERHSHTTLMQRINSMPWLSKATAVLATAASILIVYAGISSFTGTALAFADVVEVLNQVRSATWKTTTKTKGPDNKLITWTSEHMFLTPAHERMETTTQDAKSVMITDGQKNQVLILEPKSKTAMYIDVKNTPTDREGPFGKTFEDFRQMAADAKTGNGGKVTPLGAATIDGRRAEGFRIERNAIEVRIWADPETSLPIRVEEKAIDGTEVNIVMTDFQIDVPLDESPFSMDVPEGYTPQQRAEIDLSKNPIHYLAYTLKLVAELNDGVFPPELRGEEGIDGIMRRNTVDLGKKIAEEIGGKEGKTSPDVLRRATMDLSMKMGATFGMLFALSPEQNDLHYTGKNVKLGTPDTPIFWYKPTGADKYRVIYADLSIKEVPRDQLPSLPATE